MLIREVCMMNRRPLLLLLWFVQVASAALFASQECLADNPIIQTKFTADLASKGLKNAPCRGRAYPLLVAALLFSATACDAGSGGDEPQDAGQVAPRDAGSAKDAGPQSRSDAGRDAAAVDAGGGSAVLDAGIAVPSAGCGKTSMMTFKPVPNQDPNAAVGSGNTTGHGEGGYVTIQSGGGSRDFSMRLHGLRRVLRGLSRPLVRARACTSPATAMPSSTELQICTMGARRRRGPAPPPARVAGSRQTFGPG